MGPDRIVRTVIYCDYASVIGTVPPGIRKSLYDCWITSLIEIDHNFFLRFIKRRHFTFWDDKNLTSFFLVSKERKWRFWLRPYASACKLYQLKRQSLHLLPSRENHQKVRRLKSDVTEIKWRHRDKWRHRELWDISIGLLAKSRILDHFRFQLSVNLDPFTAIEASWQTPVRLRVLVTSSIELRASRFSNSWQISGLRII